MTESKPTAPARIAPAGLMFLAITSVGWGFNWPVTKYLLSELPPLTLRGSTGVIGAALLLSAPSSWLCRKVLATPAFVWIGLISYPLYLWHWPLLVFFAQIKFAPLTLIERELALMKVVGLGKKRTEAVRWADKHGANIVESTPKSFVFQMVGTSAEIDNFVAGLKPLGLVEVSRTGAAAIASGAKAIDEDADSDLRLTE